MLDILAALSPASLILVPLLALGLYGLGAFMVSRPNPDHAKVNWSPLEAVALTIAIYATAQIIAGVVVGLYIAATGGNTDQISQLLSESPSIQFVFIATVDGISAGMIYLFLKKRHTAARAIGIVRPQWRDIGYTVLGFFAYLVLYLVVVNLVQNNVPAVDLDQKQDLGFNMDTSGYHLLPIFLSLVILPPLLEETLMRGVLFTGLRQRYSFWIAGLVTSIIFASAHLLGGASGEGLLWVAAIDTFVLSLVLVTLREKSGSLWPGIGLHFVKNGIAFLALFVWHVT